MFKSSHKGIQSRRRSVGLAYSEVLLSLSETILRTEPDDLLGYWPLNELAGNVIYNLQGDAARNGTYSNVTLGDNKPPFICPLFNGTTSVGDLFTPSIASVFPKSEATMMIFAKFNQPSDWSSGFVRAFLGANLLPDDDALLYNGLNSTKIYLFRYANMVSKASFIDMGSQITTWMHIVGTWSEPMSRLLVYVNAVPDTIATSIGIWTDPLLAFVLGGAPGTPNFAGNLAHCALWGTELSQSQIYRIYRASGIDVYY